MEDIKRKEIEQNISGTSVPCRRIPHYFCWLPSKRWHVIPTLQCWLHTDFLLRSTGGGGGRDCTVETPDRQASTSSDESRWRVCPAVLWWAVQATSVVFLSKNLHNPNSSWGENIRRIQVEQHSTQKQPRPQSCQGRQEPGKSETVENDVRRRAWNGMSQMIVLE